MLRNRFQINRIRTGSDLFACMEAHADLLAGCAALLAQAANAEPELRSALIVRISHKEREADDLIQAIRDAPSVVEAAGIRSVGVRRIVEACENVLDRLEDTACRISDCSIAQVPPDFIDACSLLHQCAELTSQGVSRADKGDEVVRISDQIRSTRKTAETHIREACAHLLATGGDPTDIVKMRELYSFLERTLEAVKGTADALLELGNAD